MTPKELNDLNNEAAVVLDMNQLATRLIRNGNYFDEVHEYTRMNDCYKTADIIRAAIPFIIQGLHDIEEGKVVSDAAKIYRATLEESDKTN